MTREDVDFISGMNMCDEISNEAYKKIMCHCEEHKGSERVMAEAEYINRNLIEWYGCDFEDASCENRECAGCSHAECSHSQVMQIPTADAVERSKVDDAIKEMKALADSENTILGYNEKMGLKIAMNILVRSIREGK